MSDIIVTHRLQCTGHHLPVELEQDISQETCKPYGITRKPGGGGAGVLVKASWQKASARNPFSCYFYQSYIVTNFKPSTLIFYSSLIQAYLSDLLIAQ